MKFRMNIDVCGPVFTLPVCRTCLQNKGSFIRISDSKVTQMLRDCNLCVVSENDGLPNQICSTCFQILEQCYTFKELCRRSEFTLRHTLEKERQTKSHNHVKICIFPSQESHSEDIQESVLDVQEDSLGTCIDVSGMKADLTDSLNDDLISFLDKPLPPPLPYQCQWCNQSYEEEEDLKVHHSVHNSDLTCLACSKQFKGRQTLKRHIKIHLIQKPHICKLCGKRFAESYALVKHLRHHSGIPREKKHFCENCGQGFSEPYYLKLHKRKHTGERPLVCPECQKAFADPRSFKTHVMVHKGNRPYKCRFCSKGFIQNANLTKHLRVHTGEKPYSCKICDKKFSQSSSLDKHSRVHKIEHCMRISYNKT